MITIKTDNWKPIDDISLENAAIETVKSKRNTLVVAGPGSGKSELLAQRASYLLQTNECKHPHKILALSYKKDSAVNIKDRVNKRCGNELTNRFRSTTFDGFAKSLVDQFLNAIPQEYRPSINYKIVDDNEVNKIYKNLEINLTKEKLPINNHEKCLIRKAWKLLLNTNDKDESILTFEMIGRLAEYLLANNNTIKNALNMTYTHVFLDEFQDTTLIQYDLLKTCFNNSNTIITAVGDDKQRIMEWAGALKDGFERFTKDFNADKKHLLMNHRSAPKLLMIQNTIYKEYFYKNNNNDTNIPKNEKWKNGYGECFLHLFKNDDQEAEIISKEIQKVLISGYKERDICILSKNKPTEYTKKLISSLKNLNIKARDEKIYQDLLKEDIVKLLFNFMKIITCENNANEWAYMLNEIRCLDNNKYEYLEKKNNLNFEIDKLKKQLNRITNQEEFYEFINNLIEFLGKDNIKANYVQYKNESNLNYFVTQLHKLLWKEYKENNIWEMALKNFMGENSIPVMTIHKSKGLEYKYIIFIGLEDNAFWNFKNQTNEDFCTFFVAMSRAKQRLDFTFSETRKTLKKQNQSKESIHEFYEILEKSGEVEIKQYNKQNEKYYAL